MKYENDPSFKLLPAKLVLVACLYPYEPALTRVFNAERKKKKSFQSRLINCSHPSIIDLSEPIVSAVEQVNNPVQSGSLEASASLPPACCWIALRDSYCPDKAQCSVHLSTSRKEGQHQRTSLMDRTPEQLLQCAPGSTRVMKKNKT